MPRFSCIFLPKFSCIFLPFLVNQTQTQINLQQEHKHKPNNRSSQIFSNHKTHIYKLNHNSNPDFLIFQSTTKPPANKIHKPRNQIHKPRKFSIKKKKIINSKVPILKLKQIHFSVLFQSLFGCQENERIKIWIAPSKSIPSKPNSNQIQIKKFI